jgi:hypothetical protein
VGRLDGGGWEKDAKRGRLAVLWMRVEDFRSSLWSGRLDARLMGPES